MTDGTYTLDELIDMGWRDAKSDPPEHSRVVRIAYDDGSHSDKTRGVFDSISGDESRGRLWWDFTYSLHLCPTILAWREIYP